MLQLYVIADDWLVDIFCHLCLCRLPNKVVVLHLEVWLMVLGLVVRTRR